MQEETGSNTTPTDAKPRRRAFRDPDGRHWEVYQATLPYDRRCGECLIFESTEAVRRVLRYPTDWFNLSDEELYDLSYHR